MAEPTQKQILAILVGDIKEIKLKQTSLDKKQDGMDLKLTSIDTELTGTSYDKTRGIVPRLNIAEKNIVKMKRNQTKIITWGLAIFGSINIIGIIIAIINNVKG